METSQRESQVVRKPYILYTQSFESTYICQNGGSILVFNQSEDINIVNRPSARHNVNIIVAWMTLFTFGYVSRDPSLIIGQSGMVLFTLYIIFRRIEMKIFKPIKIDL